MIDCIHGKVYRGKGAGTQALRSHNIVPDFLVREIVYEALDTMIRLVLPFAWDVVEV